MKYFLNAGALFLMFFCLLMQTEFVSAIEPSKVALVASKGNAKSEALAKYYAQKRAIPEENVLLIEFASEDELGRKEWNEDVKPAIKSWLNEHVRKNRIDCLVVLRGVSLNVVGKDDSLMSKSLEKFCLQEESLLLGRIIRAEWRLKAIAGDVAQEPSLEEVKDLSVADLGKRFNTIMEAANAKIAGMASNSSQVQSFAPLLLEVGGIDLVGTMLANSLKKQEAQNSQQTLISHSSLMGASESLVYMINASTQSLPTPEIIRLRAAAIERKGGLLGALEYYRKQRAETVADRTTCLDSELATILWPDTLQFQTTSPNFSYLHNGRVSTLNEVYTTLMIGRIDGPTWPICKRMIDDAVSAEGNATKAAKYYFDLRGLDQKAASSGEVSLENALGEVAKAYQKMFDERTVVNQELNLFEENSCPDILVYCGWLEPGKYSKLGSWLPGAIGYHISPISASELHATESDAWCNRMLSDGATVVLGVTDFLPYELMVSPAVFAPEKFDGKRSIVEVYFENLPFLKTTNVLLGDPLFRPAVR